MVINALRQLRMRHRDSVICVEMARNGGHLRHPLAIDMKDGSGWLGKQSVSDQSPLEIPC
jgi:uncharacterized membrane protein